MQEITASDALVCRQRVVMRDTGAMECVLQSGAFVGSQYVYPSVLDLIFCCWLKRFEWYRGENVSNSRK